MKTKTLIIVIAVIVLLSVGFYFWNKSKTPSTELAKKIIETAIASGADMFEGNDQSIAYIKKLSIAEAERLLVLVAKKEKDMTANEMAEVRALVAKMRS